MLDGDATEFIIEHHLPTLMSVPTRRLAQLCNHLADQHGLSDTGKTPVAARPVQAAGLLSWVRGLLGGKPAAAAGRRGPHILVGTYTNGEPVVMEDGTSISFTSGHAPGAYLLALDRVTGLLAIVDTVTNEIGENPSYAAHNPATCAVYFTSEPGGVGVVKAYSVGRDWNRAAGEHASALLVEGAHIAFTLGAFRL